MIGAEGYVINPAFQPYLPKRELTLPRRGQGQTPYVRDVMSFQFLGDMRKHVLALWLSISNYE